MPETMPFTIGTEVRCSDDICGELSRVVVDPLARTVTHIVVEPKHRRGLGRLVSLDLVDTTSDGIRLRCTQAEFDHLDAAEETQFLPGGGGWGGYGPGEVLAWPFYGLYGDSGGGAGLGLGMGSNVSLPITYDKIPVGEVAVRRGEHVHATDGDIGRVQGLVIDAEDHHVTHVLLQEGHIWGRKEVAIPISAVTGVSDGIRLNMTKEQVEGLPPVTLDQSPG